MPGEGIPPGTATQDRALHESNEQFRMMFQGHDAVMLLIEPESGRIIDVNHAAEAFYGYPAEVMKRMSIQDINTLSPEEIATERENAKSRKQSHFVFPHRLANGEVRTVEVYSSPIMVQQKQLLFSIIHDITSRVQIEKQLADAYAFNELILSASPVGIATYDFQGQCISMNEQGLRLIGATREQALRQNFRRLGSWKKSGLLEQAEKTLATGEQNRSVLRHLSTFNKEIWLDAIFSTFSVAGNVHLLVVFSDITDFKTTERALTESEQRLFSFLDSLPVGVFVATPEGAPYYVNLAASNLLGQGIRKDARKDSLAEEYKAYVAGTDRLYPAGDMPLIKALTGNEITVDNMEIARGNARIRLEVSGKTIYSSDGSIQYALGIFTDITAKKQGEEKIRQLLNEQQIILDNIAVGVGYFVNRTIIWSNKALNRMFGFGPDELNGGNTLAFYPDPESYHRVGQEAYTIVNGGGVYNSEVQMKKKDGRLFWCNIVGQAVNREHPEEGSIWMLQDVSDRKNAEEAITDSYHRLQTLVDSLDEIVYVADMETHEMLLMNKFAVTLFGDGIGRKCWDVLQQGQTGPCPFCTNAKLFNADGTLRDTYVWEIQNTANGRWYECRDKAIRWVNDRIVRMEVAIDITERKAARQELLKIEKLESVGILAGGIAHDFNNLLQGILGNITIAKLQGVSEEQRLQWLSSAEKACEMAHELTQRLIIFSKGGDPVRSLEHLDTLLREPVNLALKSSRVLPEYIFPEETISVFVDPGQIRQVFRNLAINAKEAMPDGGRLIITARRMEPGRQENPALPDGACAEVIFSDTGIGIPAEALPKIFDPYFSTKDRGSQKGMGLGLTISDAIVRKHGGRITVESRVGAGTTFRIYLPAATDEGTGI